jgi:ABC-type glycerol-3-phosphate transport system substrate-binding protein
MTKSLLRSIAVLAALALAACAAEDAQTDQRGIDQDITATHDAGAPTLNNIGQSIFAPWRLNMAP